MRFPALNGLRLRIPSRCSKRGIVQMCFCTDDHTPVTSKVEVGGGFSHVDLPDKHTRWVEDMNTVTHARVEISMGISVNTYHLMSGIASQNG